MEVNKNFATLLLEASFTKEILAQGSNQIRKTWGIN